mmetsp:Transcript_13542/g.20905  ORF Transcript_13542/g.20905 Transcript_13542/m.20905 type:complete len:95 (-) Transcript_13542:1727-2011(-)
MRQLISPFSLYTTSPHTLPLSNAVIIINSLIILESSTYNIITAVIDVASCSLSPKAYPPQPYPPPQSSLLMMTAVPSPKQIHSYHIPSVQDEPD